MIRKSFQLLVAKLRVTNNISEIVINNVPSPEYSTDTASAAKTFRVRVYSIFTFRLEYVFTYETTTLTVLNCGSFTAASVAAASKISGIRTTFSFSFILGHRVNADTGWIGVLLPEGYPYSLFDMETTCELLNIPLPAVCSIDTPRMISITLNGYEMNVFVSYSFALHGMNTW